MPNVCARTCLLVCACVFFANIRVFGARDVKYIYYANNASSARTSSREHDKRS